MTKTVLTIAGSDTLAGGGLQSGRNLPERRALPTVGSTGQRLGRFRAPAGIKPDRCGVFVLGCR